MLQRLAVSCGGSRLPNLYLYSLIYTTLRRIVPSRRRVQHLEGHLRAETPSQHPHQSEETRRAKVPQRTGSQAYVRMAPGACQNRSISGWISAQLSRRSASIVVLVEQSRNALEIRHISFVGRCVPDSSKGAASRNTRRNQNAVKPLILEVFRTTISRFARSRCWLPQTAALAFDSGQSNLGSSKFRHWGLRVRWGLSAANARNLSGLGAHCVEECNDMGGAGTLVFLLSERG